MKKMNVWRGWVSRAKYNTSWHWLVVINNHTFYRSDWRHKLCRDFVVLAVPMTLADFPPYAKETLSNVTFFESYPKFSNLHEITHFFSRCNTYMFALLISKLEEKLCCVWLKIANWKYSLYKSIQIQFTSAAPFSSAVGGVSADMEQPPTARLFSTT